MNPMNSELWPAFKDFASENGVSLDNNEDWQAWWNCFEAGADAYVDNMPDNSLDVE